MAEKLQIRIFGDAGLPTLVYLPGLHGDWSLVTSFRVALANRARFVEITYPRSLTWNIGDYAIAIHDALRNHGITQAWLLAESFGSQVAWELLNTQNDSLVFEGMVLAGGFVKHPWKWGPSALHWIGERISMKAYQRQIRFYAWYARFRFRRAPETKDSLQEFVARRTEFDRQAMRRRLKLVDEYDARPIARRATLPVYYLDGLVDPLVPWPSVRWWLRNNCPGYRGGKIFFFADHNVLTTAPSRAAERVLKWMQLEAKHQHPTAAAKPVGSQQGRDAGIRSSHLRVAVE